MGSEVRQVSCKAREFGGAEMWSVLHRGQEPLPAWAWEEQSWEGDPSEGHRGEAAGATEDPSHPSGLNPAYTLSPRMLSLAPKAQKQFPSGHP